MVPGSSNRPDPLWPLPCQMPHMAPVGSEKAPPRPCTGTSNTGPIGCAPAATAAAIVASASATATYEIQHGGAPISSMFWS